MNTPKTSDDVMQELNDLAKAQGRYLGNCFWEIPRSPGSILDVPLTPEEEERIRRLDTIITGLHAQRSATEQAAAKESESVKQLQVAVREMVQGQLPGEMPEECQ